MKFHLDLFLLILGVCGAFGKEYEQCDLFFRLMDLGVNTEDRLKFMCIMERGGKRDTITITPNLDGTLNYGICQIPQEFCGYQYPDGLCNVLCTDLLDDDVNVSLNCALKVHKNYGFQAWKIWSPLCEGVNHQVACD